MLGRLAGFACAFPIGFNSGMPPPAPKEVISRIDPDYVRGAIERLAGFGTRHSLSDQDHPTRGIGAARAWLLEEFKGHNLGGFMRVSFEEFEAPVGPRIPRGVKFANVVAVLPGTMPEAAGRRYYVVGHYDSMPSSVMDPESDAPGANDDASGTAVVLAIARALGGHPCESTIVFLCTVGEEQGLIGAKHHAEQAAARGEDIRAVLSNDIVGDPLGPGGDPRLAARHVVRVFSEGIPRLATAEELARIRNFGGESDSKSRQLARFVAEVGKKEGLAVEALLIFRQDRLLRGGDHSAFNEAGFPAVRFTEVYEDYRHQHQTPRTEKGPDGEEVVYGDHPEFVDAGYVADVAKLNAAALLHLANAPSEPRRARIITARLENETRLRWDPSPEPDVAGYEVVWRMTTDSQWIRSRDVGLVTEAVVPASKDNHFFGVRAYDNDGYRSPVVFCGAGRD